MANTSFSYFDQYTDVVVDMTPYIASINSTLDESLKYKYSFTNIQPIKTTLKNLFDKVDLVGNFKSDISFFNSYVVQDGESPQKVSNDFYGTMDNWWIIALFNDMKNMVTDWPMKEDQIQKTADILYQKEGKYSREMYYQLLFDRNETRRNILVLKSIYINDVISAFRNEIERLNLG